MGRILAVDLGTRRVGLAITDPLQMIASPLKSISFQSEKRLIAELLAILADKGVERVVIGLPIREDGSEGEGCLRSRNLARKLQARGITAVLWDERYSSREAENTLRALGLRRKQAVAKIDPLAAAIILEDYLAATAGAGSSPKP